ncbi:hypothetical protein HAD_02620 [Hyphomonas adhaerens MHS-3]|uniref:Uncharacterized protein n=1 Tax=Hyphomonas adhaerens MHS-3 TaxID=1280949 RepID=A0A069E3J7_9PROT|nr:hypothetical protein [Hyphomonas adhaerens]KCZ84537.1 hypothetical protein HAD_02620 [Hyphomonas adhaerens MHS-3]
MSKKFETTDSAAKRLLLLHHLRVRHLLSDLPAAVRRELETGLDDHLAEVFDHIPGADDHERLKVALERLGDPRDFLAPLIGDVLLSQSGGTARPSALVSNMFALATSGAKSLVTLAFNAFLGVTGAIMLIFSVAFFLRPGMAGVFPTGEDGYQVRIMGWPTDEVSVLPVWGTLVIGLVGLGLLYLSQRWMWRAATSLIARAFPAV